MHKTIRLYNNDLYFQPKKFKKRAKKMFYFFVFLKNVVYYEGKKKAIVGIKCCRIRNFGFITFRWEKECRVV